jgi:hypothetical protein
MALEINYNEQMLNYYPEVIKGIREFQVLIESQSPQVEGLHDELTKALSNAYIIDADEARISAWEQYLGIVPLPRGNDSVTTWLSDRRETILARLYTPEKLNSKSIANLVSIFTGGSAESCFKNGDIQVRVLPSPSSKGYKFENLQQELRKKVPAHLGCTVDRYYPTWGEIKSDNTDWMDVYLNYETWDDVRLNNRIGVGQLDVTELDNFILDRG